jgi:hypothetical protein
MIAGLQEVRLDPYLPEKEYDPYAVSVADAILSRRSWGPDHLTSRAVSSNGDRNAV